MNLGAAWEESICVRADPGDKSDRFTSFLISPIFFIKDLTLMLLNKGLKGILWEENNYKKGKQGNLSYGEESMFVKGKYSLILSSIILKGWFWDIKSWIDTEKIEGK